MNSLGEIGAATGHATLGTGTTEVWYMRRTFRRDGVMGAEWLVEHNMLPTARTLGQTHVLLGTVDLGSNRLPGIWLLMQGENWSPNGEARALIRSLGLVHTSMDVGDVIKCPDGLFLVDNEGFVKLPEEPAVGPEGQLSDALFGWIG